MILFPFVFLEFIENEIFPHLFRNGLLSLTGAQPSLGGTSGNEYSVITFYEVILGNEREATIIDKVNDGFCFRNVRLWNG